MSISTCGAYWTSVDVGSVPGALIPRLRGSAAGAGLWLGYSEHPVPYTGTALLAVGSPTWWAGHETEPSQQESPSVPWLWMSS